MKKRSIFLSLLLVGLMVVTACSATAEKTPVNIAVLKGPTGMSAAFLMAQNEAGETENDYAFTIAGAPDVLVSQLITGELDMAALPTNTIAMLHQKTNGAVQCLAVNTLGVLYLLERGDSVHGVTNLEGKTIVSAAQGTTTEAVATELFGNGVTVDYVSEHAEAVAQAIAGKYDLVLLPEPFVTSLLTQDDSFRIALDITATWEAETGGVMPMGGIAVRVAFVDTHPEAVAAFLSEYAGSVAYTNEHPAEAAELIQRYDIMQAAVAEKAIPRANMVCLTGEDMLSALTSFYAVLMEGNPALIGNALPGDGFYYVP